MNTIKENELRQKIRKALSEIINEEDIRNYKPSDMGIYDRPIGSFDSESDDIDADAEERKEFPVGPSPDAQMQLSQQKPDIENPEYVPVSIKELQRAMYELGEKIPESQIRDVYRNIADLITSSIDKDFDESREIKEVSDLPKSVRTIPLPGRATIDQRAQHTGVGSIAQQATFENRLLKKIKAILTTADDAKIDLLLNASVEAYLAVMRDAGHMDDEDIAFFTEKPSRKEQVKDSDLFRSFVGNAILQNGMRAIRLKVEKIIDAEVESLDIPAGADLTIRNHIMGNTALTYQKFINLIGKKAEKDSKYDIDKLYDLSKNLPSILRNLRKLVDSASSEELIPVAFTEWVKSSKQKKIKLLTKSAQDLANLYDAENRS